MAPLVLAFALFAQTSTSGVGAVEIPFRTVSFGMNGKIKEGGTRVIRNAKAFDSYRKEMGMDEARKPVIDWSKEQLVAVNAAGIGYGGSAIQVGKVRRKADGSLEIEASLDRSSQPALPQPGVVQVLRKEGIYALVAVAKSTSEATLKIVDPPRN